MGKKDKKKSKDTVRTSKREEERMSKKLRTMELVAGEVPLEDILRDIESKQKQSNEITFKLSAPPSPRSNFTFVANPDEKELILFGGEFYNGKKNFTYQELFIYHVSTNLWTLVESDNTPLPRCAHQAVTGKYNNANSMFLFGGEFASESQTRFHHYKDLWALNLKSKKWSQIKTSSGPCARSGHRMAPWKQGFLLFGGFSDSGCKTVYYNDLWSYDGNENFWTKIQLPSIPQIVPRSGGSLFTSADFHSAFIYGGYSKQPSKSDDEKGIVHTDCFQVQISGGKNLQVQLTSLRLGGCKPNPPRTCMACQRLRGGNNQCLFFGGVHDEEEDSDEGPVMKSQFSQDLLLLDLDKAKWLPFNYSEEGGANVPQPRMRAGLALIGNQLFLYGGSFEGKREEVTLDDMHCLDLTQRSWKCIHPGSAQHVVCASDSEDEETTSSEEDVEAPLPLKSETQDQYLSRTLDFWCKMAEDEECEEMSPTASCPFSDETIALAKNMASTFFSDNKS
ncbi:hypothetical protein Ciccas_003212 [Cichlidogyrus casuarinus]|uniref:Kelch domain-containing protein 4 n=1 Tax=Cichlidogyrus casuarinus TaxID=1844966 RepID=A0ABD2QF75_9PLAT